ncbi:gfo/Idh/MocA family oxidoreductase, partial [Candidatus Poribacteria bacterium]|nr:gfo/Idh/MocA family oxidoreductase [Candidatus Poribacteria bacterium]
QQLTDNVSPDEIEASGEAGLRVQEIVEAAIESFTTKTVVTL